MNVKDHVIYSLLNAQVRRFPYPHFFCEEVFPRDFYYSILGKLPPDTDYQPVSGHYEGRSFSPPIEDFAFFSERDFMKAVMAIFQPEAKARFPAGTVDIRIDLRLIRDRCGYAIGPHTDAKWKLISLIFYLPLSAVARDCGTSIYLPKDRKFRCEGGPHWDRENFDLIYTMPYVPNSCFGFWKTDHSWHGVEPIAKEIQRDSLLYNIYWNHESVKEAQPKSGLEAES